MATAGQLFGQICVSVLNLCHDTVTVAEIQVGQLPLPPPSVNRHVCRKFSALSEFSKQLNVPKLMRKIIGA